MSKILGEISGNRRRNTEVSTELRAAILVAKASGEDTGAIVNATGVSEWTIRRAYQRYQQRQTLAASPRSGRPKIFDDRLLRRLKIHVRYHPRSTYKEIRKALGVEASDTTISDALSSLNLEKWRAAKRIPLSTDNMKDRLLYCSL